MTKMNELFYAQKKNALTLRHSEIYKRVEKLEKLKRIILENREDIKLAIFNDFKKPYSESELTEIHTTIDELNVAIKNTKKWSREKSVRTPIALFGARSFIQYQPKGVVLIMAPWNYPFSMVMHPLIAAISAGNTAIIKPSEKTSHVANVIDALISNNFREDEICVIQGDASTAQELLELPFDHIFFTGNETVGKYVMEKASKHLTPVTLELGGKSPVIVDSSAHLDDCVDKLTWGKFINAGQTCVAPDYCFVDYSLKDEFLLKMKNEIKHKFGNSYEEQKESKSFARIIDQRAYERLNLILKDANISYAPNSERFIPPTIIEDATFSSLSMKEEIFGPILPVIFYKDLDEVISYINANAKPLALYIFSKNSKNIKKILNQTTSGGVGINHVILQLANSNLPFGGIGRSGMGSYHGYFGFKTFSHERSVLKQSCFTLSHLYFQPYAGKISKFAYKFLRKLE